MQSQLGLPPRWIRRPFIRRHCACRDDTRRADAPSRIDAAVLTRTRLCRSVGSMRERMASYASGWLQCLRGKKLEVSLTLKESLLSAAGWHPTGTLHLLPGSEHAPSSFFPCLRDARAWLSGKARLWRISGCTAVDSFGGSEGSGRIVS